MIIKIYSTPRCPWCVAAKDFFSSINLPFEDIDVSIDEKAAELMIEKSGQTGVPVIEINDQIIVGFNKPLIEEILKQSKLDNKENSA